MAHESRRAALLKKHGLKGVNKPKRTPDHKTKSHMVLAAEGHSMKLIRFGQQGVRGAGKNPTTAKDKARKKSYYARHNAQGKPTSKLSAKYWSHKVKWQERNITMADESYMEKRKRILEEQKKRKKQRDADKKMTGGLDDGKVKLKKSKSSKLGSSSKSGGSKNPAAAMQNKSTGDKKAIVNKESAMSFFEKYIAGRKTKTKNKENAKTRVESKTKSKTSKKTPSMADIRSKNKEELSSFFSKYIAGRKTRNLVSNPKGVSQGSKTSKSPKSSLGMPKVSQGSTMSKKITKKKAPIVTKEQLAKSGLSLRDYLNMKQGKTRRDYKDVKAAARKKRAKGAIT